MRKKLEKVGALLGYKYLRYGLPYQRICDKNKDKIHTLKSILMDDLSVKTVECVIKSGKTRNYNYLQDVYNHQYEKSYADLFGESFYVDPSVMYDSSQYFPEEIIRLSSSEVFIDGGGYVGDTTLNLINNTNNRFKKIHIFEPIQCNINNLHHIYNFLKIDSSKIMVHHLGLSASEKEISFNQNFSGARMDGGGNTIVKVVGLDAYLSEEERKEITYIKLDIEGSEMEALEGMRETITTYKPKLAICVYHKPTDLWEIPLFIKQLNPSYKLYIRQHHPVYETVCYAV